MSEPTPETPASQTPFEGRLDSWKEIADYLKRDVTTVQRWEKREGMPVHRHVHDRMGSVYASRSELDAWKRTRNLRAVPETGITTALVDPPAQQSQVKASTPQTKWRLILTLAATASALAIFAGLWLHITDYFWRNPLAKAQPKSRA